MSDLKVEKDTVVTFTYSILNDEGEVAEQNDVPTDYVHGSDDNIFPAVMAEALEGASIGESREILLPPEIGYGAYDKNKTYRAKIEDLPAEYNQIGYEATFRDQEGKELLMKVISVDNGEIFLEGNHPFAGKTMKVRMTVKAIRQATQEEIGSGISERYQQNPPGNNSLH